MSWVLCTGSSQGTVKDTITDGTKNVAVTTDAQKWAKNGPNDMKLGQKVEKYINFWILGSFGKIWVFFASLTRKIAQF